MKVGLIFARSSNGVIGTQGKLPWKSFPEDMGHFKATTMGHPVIMGRKTWDSIPSNYRPLDGRMNIVMTRAVDCSPHPLVWVASDVQGALKAALDSGAKVAYVIGGGAVYDLFLPYADFACVTEVLKDFDGDTYAPKMTGWQSTRTSPVKTSKTGLKYQVSWYKNPVGAKR